MDSCFPLRASGSASKVATRCAVAMEVAVSANRAPAEQPTVGSARVSRARRKTARPPPPGGAEVSRETIRPAELRVAAAAVVVHVGAEVIGRAGVIAGARVLHALAFVARPAGAVVAAATGAGVLHALALLARAAGAIGRVRLIRLRNRGAIVAPA